MSRPVFEPSLTRADAALGYGSRQLFRRPAPVSGAAGMEPTVILFGGGTIAPSGTWMPIPFWSLAYDPAVVTEFDDFSWAITDDGDTGNDRYELTTHTAGWYEWELVTQWDEMPSGGTAEFGYAVQRITWDSVAGFFFDNNDMRNSGDWNDYDIHPNFEMFDNGWLRGIGRVHVPTNKAWLPTGKQVTGVDRGLSGIFLRVSFLGADDLSAWTFESV